MGFTRYWVRPMELDAERFRVFAKACEKACAALDCKLVDATFSADEVRFDGEPGCETFLIERVATRGRSEDRIFEFCKTQSLPYDAAVKRCLQILQVHFHEVEIPEPS